MRDARTATPLGLFGDLRWRLLKPVLLEPVFLAVILATGPGAAAAAGEVPENLRPWLPVPLVAGLFLAAARSIGGRLWRESDPLTRQMLPRAVFVQGHVLEVTLLGLLAAPALLGIGGLGPGGALLLAAGLAATALGAVLSATLAARSWAPPVLLLAATALGVVMAQWPLSAAPALLCAVALLRFAPPALARRLERLAPEPGGTGRVWISPLQLGRLLPLPAPLRLLLGRDLTLHLRGLHNRHWLLLLLALLVIPWSRGELAAVRDARLLPITILQGGTMGIVALAYGLGPDLQRTRARWWPLERITPLAPSWVASAALGYAVGWCLLYVGIYSWATAHGLRPSQLGDHRRASLTLAVVAVAAAVHATSEALRGASGRRVRGEGVSVLGIPAVALVAGIGGLLAPPFLLLLVPLVARGWAAAVHGVKRWQNLR